MTSLAAILEFKFPGVEGLRTREKRETTEPVNALCCLSAILNSSKEKGDAGQPTSKPH